jgi:hypothetical protein
VGEHVGEGGLVVVPVLAFLGVGSGKLPILLGQVDSLEEPDPLLLFGQVQEQLDDLEPVVGQGSAPRR